MPHSEAFNSDGIDWEAIRSVLGAKEPDAQMIIWGPRADIQTALETITERCRLAFDGVPNETRKSLPDGTTIFERVLPGPDRMYPDTDSAPIPIEDKHIERIRDQLPVAIDKRMAQLREWGIPEDTYRYILKRNLVWIIQKIIEDFEQPSKFVGTLFGHVLRHIEYRASSSADFNYYSIYGLFKFIHSRKLERTIAKELLPHLYMHPKMAFGSILTTIGYRERSTDEIVTFVPTLTKKFAEISNSRNPAAEIDWIMGNLRKTAIGNVPLSELREIIEKRVVHE
jgi:glutamyl-tRNA(Gln) amidotransferase subunit E